MVNDGVCRFCGKSLPLYSRSTKRFCDGKCRIANHRKKSAPKPFQALQVQIEWLQKTNGEVNEGT